MGREFIARSTKMPRSIEQLSASASSLPNRSWEAFIINIAGSDFRYTQGFPSARRGYRERTKPAGTDMLAGRRQAKSPPLTVYPCGTPYGMAERRRGCKPRDCRQRGSARGQVQECAAGK